eukprot:Nitzschia sp. Nitz4//scaffold11_size288233//124866//127356//NITZ4_000770-RA/size288233-snap-gene-0.22-mRNA-1//1//CDS//3329534062//7420//frame0
MVVPRSKSTASVKSAETDVSESSRPAVEFPRKVPVGDLAPPVLVYHESARSIVFRDHIRRVTAEEMKAENNAENPDRSIHSSHHRHVASEREKEISREWSSELNEMSNMFGAAMASDRSVSSDVTIEIQGYTPNIVPLPHLQLEQNDEFTPLLESDFKTTGTEWTEAEKEIVSLLDQQRAVVKTIKNNDWTDFLHRFLNPAPPKGYGMDDHNDIAAHKEGDIDYPFNSFVTSTSLLPPGGLKMRAYGNANVYTTGVIFGLPEFASPEEENAAVEKTRTWSWPSGYSAKTEFNIDSRGNLINGRQEALVPFHGLRDLNNDFVTKNDYLIGGRVVQGGLHHVPYNEVFVRVGGLGRVVAGKDCATGEPRVDLDGTGRSFEKGVGLPEALFVRTATYGHLVSLLRTRARLQHVWGEEHIDGIPLLYLTPDDGVRVLTERLQGELLKISSEQLNPFQDPMISHKTTVDDTDDVCLQTKVEELISLDKSIRSVLTPEECGKLAGGFGVTDESIAAILKDAMLQDKQDIEGGAHHLQDIVNEGLAAAVRSGDYYTSRQLLILYTLVASESHNIGQKPSDDGASDTDSTCSGTRSPKRKSSFDGTMVKKEPDCSMMLRNGVPAPPPPPPLDTDRLRSATNSDGLLAVLGAAQILRAMKDGSAKKRTAESFLAVEEWVEQGEQSMAFRLASWREQRAAQGDLQIATANNSSLMAFVSNKAITNRKNFAKHLREVAGKTDFSDVRFLRAIHEMVERMHSPCLRLELLQYVLGLDNRYSIAHVKRSIELATTCLSMSVAPSPDAAQSGEAVGRV